MSGQALSSTPDLAHRTAVLASLRELRDNCVRAEDEFAPLLDRVLPQHREGARNLVHYVAFRRHDLRRLQHQLADLGLSSLGRCESDVLGSLDTVIDVLQVLTGEDDGTRQPIVRRTPLLDENAEQLLGPVPVDRARRLMVTLPSEAAVDRELCERLVGAGMDIARINCAHDDVAAWQAMAVNVRDTAAGVGQPCRIAIDLAGPKLRTGGLPPGPAVVKVSPRRDGRGRVQSAASVLFHAAGERPPAHPTATPIPVDDATWIAAARWFEAVELRDARGAPRRFRVIERLDHGVVAAVTKTAYLEPGVRLIGRSPEGERSARIAALPERSGGIHLSVGDRVELVAGPMGPRRGGAELPRIDVGMAEVVAAAQPGHRVWFDDGKFGGVVESRSADAVVVMIDDAPPGGGMLRNEKGINLPDSQLAVSVLSPDDDDALHEAVGFADIVDVSFVRNADDVETIHDRLAELDAGHLGLVLKIETTAAFRALPTILLTALRSPRVGVMIARGDLAVEAGYERLAEVQEEILWLCEAGDVPVIWATQVLDQLARTGRPSRAEISDAALSVRAECIMLNKGPHIVDAMATLADIHLRMREHQHKKRTLLRRLRSWDDATGAIAD